tara:strand:+ start:717 stop:1649 length:933 start_codon:yes stop_codon:yes gene_type:complete
MGFFDDLFGSDTELVDQSQPYVIPEASRTYADPAMEYAARQLLASYFGGPGQPGMLSQPIPVPIQQTAGLSPLEIQARNLAGGLGGFAPQLNQAAQYYQQSAMGYNPMAAQSFMNPYMQNVYQPQMQEISRLGEQQKRDARSRQAQAGAFGGSRGAIQEAEIDRNTMQQQAQASGDLLYRGYGDSMDRSMGAFQDMQGRRAGAAAGMAGLGQQGYDMLSGQIGMLGGLGQMGRGIQDAAFANQYTAATQMADEPYMRMQRAMALMQGLSPFFPAYTSGFGGGMGQMGAYQDPSSFSKGLGALIGLKSLFG